MYTWNSPLWCEGVLLCWDEDLVLEGGQVAMELEFNGAGRPMPILGDDDFSKARLVVGIIVFRSMQK